MGADIKIGDESHGCVINLIILLNLALSITHFHNRILITAEYETCFHEQWLRFQWYITKFYNIRDFLIDNFFFFVQPNFPLLPHLEFINGSYVECDLTV